MLASTADQIQVFAGEHVSLLQSRLDFVQESYQKGARARFQREMEEAHVQPADGFRIAAWCFLPSFFVPGVKETTARVC